MCACVRACHQTLDCGVCEREAVVVCEADLACEASEVSEVYERSLHMVGGGMYGGGVLTALCPIC